MSGPAKRKALGRGLSALIPEPEASPVPAPASAAEVPTSTLEPNPFQPRTSMDQARLAELTASILESGIVQPILVRRRGERYQIIAGERRYRAAQAAGLATVPVTVREVADEHLLELALVENIQREELNAVEEAQAFQRLQSEFCAHPGGDRATGGAGPHDDRQHPAAAPPARASFGTWCRRGRSTPGTGGRSLALDRAEDQLALGREAARKGLSVREVERRVAQRARPRGGASGARKDANTRAAEEKLRGGPRRAGRDRAPGTQRPHPRAVQERGRAQPALRAPPAGGPRPIAC